MPSCSLELRDVRATRCMEASAQLCLTTCQGFLSLRVPLPFGLSLPLQLPFAKDRIQTRHGDKFMPTACRCISAVKRL